MFEWCDRDFTCLDDEHSLNIGRYDKLSQEMVPENNSSRFHLFPSKLSVCRKKKKMNHKSKGTFLDLHLSFYKSTELNCAFSQYKSQWMHWLQRTSFQFILVWLAARCALLPSSHSSGITSDCHQMGQQMSLHLTFQLLRSLLIKKILIFVQLITLEQWPNIILHTQFHLKWIQTCTVRWILATSSTGRDKLLFALDLWY